MRGWTRDTFNDISIEQWYDFYIDKNLKCMPEHCYLEENQIKIIRYVFIEKLSCKTKEKLLLEFKTNLIEKHKLDMIVYRLGGKLLVLQKCFPEYDIQYEDAFPKTYSEENINNIITEWININSVSIDDILNKSFASCSLNSEYDKKMTALKAATEFNSTNEIFIWYFNKNNIKHPSYNRSIDVYDFTMQADGFWGIKDNRIKRIKRYCEEECNENILFIINDTEQLKRWIYEYFRQENIIKIIPTYSKFIKGLYNLLIEAYPEINQNKVLFDWEWHIVTKYNKDLLLRMLRELVYYRLNDIIINPVEDIPKYLNKSFMKEMFSKFNKHIVRKRFENYYEWACEAFPEYKAQWTKQDFGHIISFDGIEFDSYQEKEIYEFIKKQKLFNGIKPIGRNKSGKYTFELNEEYEYERFCPDFIIEEVSINGKNRKLKKPIVIEFYGMYVENHKHKIYQYYKKKTLIKEQFYKSREDIYYIGIFPDDIKHDYKGLVEKLSSFFMFNFNIDVNKDIIDECKIINVELHNEDLQECVNI